MREIKFRAWEKTKCKMVDMFKISPLALSDAMNTQLAMLGIQGLFLPLGMPELVLMQYTGLKDSKGVEIYEGDIVEYYRKTYSNIGEVVYSNNHASYQISTTNKYMVPIRIGFSGLYGENDEILVKIIGNLYENPELLPKPGKE